MARIALALQTPTTAGITPAYATANADGFFVSSDGYTMLHVINGNASTCNVVLDTPSTVDGLAVANRTIAIPTGSERLIRLGPQYVRSDTMTNPGTVWVDFSVTATVDVAAFHH